MFNFTPAAAAAVAAAGSRFLLSFELSYKFPQSVVETFHQRGGGY
jgi:hypothetical protein